MNKTFIRATTAAACAVLLAACTNGNVLNVKDLNNPDVARAYSTPAGVESIIGTLYQQLNNGWNTTNVEPASAHACRSRASATVANFCMNVRVAMLPRNPIANDRGNPVRRGNNLADFSNFQKLARNAANLVQAIDVITAGGAPPARRREDARDRGFAQFVNAIALGYVALDVRFGRDRDQRGAQQRIPPLSGYQAVMNGGARRDRFGARDRGRRECRGGIPLPTGWINGNGMTQAQFVQFVHSWKARLRAGVARTPAERAAVSWSQRDRRRHRRASRPISRSRWVAAGTARTIAARCTSATAGMRCRSMILGMADTSGAYAAFIAAPVSTRDGSQLLIRTPDLRLPQGATRAAQNADTPYNGTRVHGRAATSTTACASDDFPGAGYGSSKYDHKRWLAIYHEQRRGPDGAVLEGRRTTCWRRRDTSTPATSRPRRR